MLLYFCLMRILFDLFVFAISVVEDSEEIEGILYVYFVLLTPLVSIASIDLIASNAGLCSCSISWRIFFFVSLCSSI